MYIKAKSRNSTTLAEDKHQKNTCEQWIIKIRAHQRHLCSSGEKVETSNYLGIKMLREI